jgi:PAS domain S-box-containing protein
MNIPLTPQLVGELIEKGYTYVLSNTSSDVNGQVTITLKPVRQKPGTGQLPVGYETYHKITQEPLQWACGVDNTTIMVDYNTRNENISPEDILEDGYFRMSDDFFRQVLESLEDYAVFTTDKNGDVNSWNTGAEKVLGYAEREVIGRNAAIFFTPDDIIRKQHELELDTALNEGRAVDERYHVRKDNSYFWGSGLVFPLYDDNGRHHGFTKVMRNLRERKEAEQNPL